MGWFALPPDSKPRASLHPWKLTFLDPAAEADYRAVTRERNLQGAQLALRLVVLLNLGFAPLDPLVFERGVVEVLAWRCITMSLVLLILLRLSYWPSWRLRWPLLLMLAEIFFTVSYLVYAAIGNPATLYYAGFLLVITGGFILLPLIFAHGMTLALLCTGLYLGGLTAAGFDGMALILLSAQLATAIVIGGFALYRQELYRRRDYESLKIIDAERGRYRDLLTSILPEPIADRLQRGETVADQFADTSVLFADIVGFTGTAARQPPEAVVGLLNDVFGTFDTLVDRHGLEKIKTIGDAYMVAGGVPEAGAEHVRAMADLALAMREAVAAMSGPEGPVQVRIGMHSGPLLAGVIGTRRFLYDLWGDTVNTASRMESLGEPGRIQVSEAVRQRLGDDYLLEPRGTIEVKGKGPLPTWYLIGRRERAVAAE